MKTLHIDEIQEVDVAPDGWELASENGWGYLALVSLQESGRLSKIVRVPRAAEDVDARDIVDDAISSYVEDTADIRYAENFLEWEWYFQKPHGSKNFWAELNSEVYKRVRSKAPLPEENYQAMLQAVSSLYAEGVEN